MRTTATFRYFAGMADKNEGVVIPVDAGFLNYVVRAPVGVVGQVVPWNFPLMFTSWKLGPALAAGNTVVMKQAELTPLSTLRIAELARDVGFPAGVINVVPGYGHIAGQYLAEHKDVDKLSFTGSTATGRRIVQASAGNLKRIQLELGGKGANIVFEDANLDAAVNGSAFAIFHNQGQACIAGSRLMLHEKIADQFLDKFLALARSIRLGNPLDPATEMGPLTSRMHQERVLSYCQVATEQGGEILTGGRVPAAPELQRGCFVEPTVVRARTPTDRVCQEEVFGPFVVVSTFKDDAEVLAMANNTIYGLGSGLWTNNLQRAHLLARHMEAGMVWINCYKRFHPGSPFGGLKDSGYGREMGHFAMHEYTEPKSVWVNVDAKIPVFYPR
jgi:aldehyde dehydrogenase (NAD+)